jgi:large subunit ribosomal protein L29
MKSRVKELRNKNSVELQQELLELLRAQFGLRMQHATQQLSNTCQLSNIRLDIARTRTILSQKARQS